MSITPSCPPDCPECWGRGRIWAQKDGSCLDTKPCPRRPATPPAPTVDAGTLRALAILGEMIASTIAKRFSAWGADYQACDAVLTALRKAQDRIAQQQEAQHDAR